MNRLNIKKGFKAFIVFLESGFKVKHQIKIGIEKFLEEDNLTGQRVGLVCNQASVNRQFMHAADLFKEKFGNRLTTLFGPQHGIRGDVQDNMIETNHTIDQVTGIPIYSLYSETREPTEEMLAAVDTLVCDLVDIGSRVYTFMYTLANCMRAAGRLGKKIIVCDRPNPINGIDFEGSLLNPEYASFVGQFPIPMRHGLTIGELALLFQTQFGIGCELEIIKMDDWQRELWIDETDTAWVMPSPNMPTIDTAAVFPGTVFFEGTQVSEGRGTTRPFEIIGAPYINAQELALRMNALKLPGVYFRASYFLPTFQKHFQKNCGGVQIHVLDRRKFKPVITGIALVQAIYQMYPNEFKWKEPPYEYVFDRNPFDVIAGGTIIREQIENNVSINKIEESWQSDHENFRKSREKVLLY